MNPSKEFILKSPTNHVLENRKDERKDGENDQNNTKREDENPNIEDVIEESFEQAHKSIAEIIITGSKVIKKIEKGVKKVLDDISK